MANSENIVNIKKISDKRNLSLISPININLLFYELYFVRASGRFSRRSHIIVHKRAKVKY